MSGFQVTPLAAFPPAGDESFPDFLQWQQDGTDLGAATVDTVNLSDGLIGTRGVGENENILTLKAEVQPFSLSWRETAVDDVVGPDDVNNAIAFTGAGAQQLTIEAGVIGVGQAVLVSQEGTGSVEFITGSGLNLLWRDNAFVPMIAGQGGIVTLIGRADGVLFLCGDMEPL